MSRSLFVHMAWCRRYELRMNPYTGRFCMGECVYDHITATTGGKR